MYNVTITIGRNIGIESAFTHNAVVDAMLCATAQFFTAYDAIGKWRDTETGNIINESSSVFIFNGVDAAALNELRNVCRVLCSELSQQAIMFEARETQILEFIEA